jgi:hypothetical protein
LSRKIMWMLGWRAHSESATNRPIRKGLIAAIKRMCAPDKAPGERLRFTLAKRTLVRTFLFFVSCDARPIIGAERRGRQAFFVV